MYIVVLDDSKGRVDARVPSIYLFCILFVYIVARMCGCYILYGMHVRGWLLF